MFLCFVFLSTEAMETILSFSKNAEELLKRKKVYRDLIFKYLAKEGVTMSPNSEKHQLVKRTLELWSSVKVGPGNQMALTSCRSFNNSEQVLYL